MDELRLVRRDDQSLIVSTDAGTEFKLIVDAGVLSEIRQMQRRERDSPRVSPRDIQRLLRAGKSHSEIATATGADESDIIRYEAPVLAERRFILSSAHGVVVRTTNADDAQQHFGAVMEERLTHLNAEAVEWSTWKDDEAGWMLGLEFISHDIAHHAIWSFDHRKAQLSPTTPDAVTLSRQGEVGDRLIPKLRAVETESQRPRFDTTFDPDALTAGLEAVPAAVAPDAVGGTPVSAAEGSKQAAEAHTDEAHEDTQPVLDPQSEFLRRREIDQRSMTTSAGEPIDLNETSDLLDALRKRRVARETESTLDTPQAEPPVTPPAQLFAAAPQTDSAAPASDNEPRPSHAVHRVDPFARPTIHLNDVQPDVLGRTTRSTPPELPRDYNGIVDKAVPSEQDQQVDKTGDKPKRKGRASIPSWDDILFGTRSEEDPV